MSNITATNNVNSTPSLSGPTQSIQLMWAQLQMQLADTAKSGALQYMDKIESDQAKQAECADVMAAMREQQNAAKTNGGCTSTDVPYDDSGKTIQQFCDENGLALDQASGDTAHSEEEWDYNIQSLQNYMDELGTSTQQDMVYVNDFMGQYNSYLQGASSTISDATDLLTNLARA